MFRSNEQRTIHADRTGQAMVEFVIILSVIMTICAGMLYANRLVLFAFWAQQEARYVSFEHSIDQEESDPLSEAEEGTYFPSRIGLLENMDWVRTPEADGLDELLARGPGSIWTKKTKPISETFSMIGSAFASQETQRDEDGAGENFQDTVHVRQEEPGYRNKRTEQLAEGFTNLLDRGGFGDKFCGLSARTFRKNGQTIAAETFERDDCPATFDQMFGNHLAENVHFPTVYREFESQLQWGLEPKDALWVTVEKELAHQVHSLVFDGILSLILNNAIVPTAIGLDRLGAISLVEDDDTYLRMFQDLKYTGTVAALSALPVAFGDALRKLPWGRDADAEKEIEDEISTILFVEADDNLGGAAFFMNLGIEDVPFFPASMVPFTAGLFNEAMRNVIAEEEQHLLSDFMHQEEFGDVATHLIEEPNKNTIVEYAAGSGLFPAARRRWAHSDEIIMEGQFYLVTQSWHIGRRVGTTGNFRQIGDENDSIFNTTEEAALRRRTSGLFLLPNRPFELISVLADPLPLEANDFLDLIAGFPDALISEVKSNVLNGPLTAVFDLVNSIPGITQVVSITPPQVPTVRTDAYPGSVEMQGDRLMGGSPRTFEDYLKEQLEYNPEPNPTFN